MKPFTHPPSGICLHHSATADGKHRDFDAIRRYHMSPAHNGNSISPENYAALKATGVQGLKAPWDEIGYHGLIERVDGLPVFIAGRSLTLQGAHEPALNATHLGLCIVGNFDLDAPDNDLLDLAAEVCRGWMERFEIPLRNVVYHCDYSPKTCPGLQFPKGGFLLQLAGEARP